METAPNQEGEPMEVAPEGDGVREEGDAIELEASSSTEPSGLDLRKTAEDYAQYLVVNSKGDVSQPSIRLGILCLSQCL